LIREWLKEPALRFHIIDWSFVGYVRMARSRINRKSENYLVGEM